MRRKLVLAAGFVSVAVVFTLIWFQPQKLLIDQEVDEALPGRSAAVAPDADQKGSSDSKDSAVKPRPALQTIRVGSFRPLAHPVSGRAKLIELRSSEIYVRFENFTVENGPDLRVYVSGAAAGSDADAFGRDFIDLGPLKGNVGDQNYPVPLAATRGKLKSTVIWCRRFSVGFAVAPLTPTGG